MRDSLAQRSHPISVLLVDDDPDMRTIYGGRLMADGYEVRFAADGPEALNAADRSLDLVLLDVRMPGMDGLEVLRRLKGDAGTAAVPVVMLSNECEESSARRAEAMGAAAWWTKLDVVPAELSRRVEHLLSSAKLVAHGFPAEEVASHGTGSCDGRPVRPVVGQPPPGRDLTRTSS